MSAKFGAAVFSAALYIKGLGYLQPVPCDDGLRNFGVIESNLVETLVKLCELTPAWLAFFERKMFLQVLIQQVGKAVLLEGGCPLAIGGELALLGYPKPALTLSFRN